MPSSIPDSAGRTLIASGIQAAKEVIRDGETGLLFRLGDTEDLAAKVLLAAGNPQLRATIGTGAREAVAERSGKRAAASYISTFHEVTQA